MIAALSRIGEYLWRVYNLIFVAAAFVWRRCLRRTTVIAISGSFGKTTATDCLAKILSDHFPTVATGGSRLGRYGLPRTLLKARPRHRFLVAEVGIDRPGVMWRSRWLLRPDVVVILRVGVAHSVHLRDLETTAREKAQLLRGLGGRGKAILNRDDERVAAMAAGLDCPVRWFGSSPDCDVWAEEISSPWPRGLRLRVHDSGSAHELETGLLGTHWSRSVLAAILAAKECGVPAAASVQSLRNQQPHTARLQPRELPSGAILIRDESNGSFGSLDAALAVLRQATARRRIVVLTVFYDGPEDSRQRARLIAEKALPAANLFLFLGEQSEALAEAAKALGAPPAAVYPFAHLRDAAVFLRDRLRSGDVALVKGLSLDHLHRVYCAQLGEVHCWKLQCARRIACDVCAELGPANRREAAVIPSAD